MYTAIINDPGYLPDTEPEQFDNCRDAWEFINSELQFDWDNSDNDIEFIKAIDELNSLNKELPGIIYTENTTYSVEWTGDNHNA